jgi:hypothetical protein
MKELNPIIVNSHVFGNHIFRLLDRQTALILEGMFQETDGVEDTTQGPNVRLHGELVSHVQIDHLRGAIHLSGFSLDLLVDSFSFGGVPDIDGGLFTTTKVTETNFTILRNERKREENK